MDVLRLVLVDDYRMVTEALASRLSTAPDLWVAGSCQTNDPRLPEVIRWLRPDLVLIDTEPLGFAVAEVLGRIRSAWPDARIVVVSADEDSSHAVDAARSGADAWVPKSQGADHLETVLRGVARGQSFWPPELLGEVLRGLRDDVQTARESSNLLDTLSPRELDVLTSMAKGKRARQIAAELMISADTVRTHTRSIFGKLEVHSRIEAVSVAWAAGLRPEEGQAATARAGTGTAGAGTAGTGARTSTAQASEARSREVREHRRPPRGEPTGRDAPRQRPRPGDGPADGAGSARGSGSVRPLRRPEPGPGGENGNGQPGRSGDGGPETSGGA
jgi:DNA-binding NarL/FixJ family response regulator